jgi:EAL domain-containing protein (putative c-di-GMP-specific phosphodiesterase class I)
MIQTLIESWFASHDGSVVFQPIFEIGEVRNMVAVEALTRGPAGTQFENAAVFFDYLRQTKQEIRADRRCVETAIRTFARADDAPAISINIHPTTLERDCGFPEFLAATFARERVDPRRVILEIVEESRYWSTQALVAAVRELRAEGVRIALDDVGVGRCNYRTVIDVAPDFLKVDRYFVHGSASDARRRAVLDSVRRLGDDIGAQVIAEGIELEDELRVVQDLGIPYAQGFLFSRPRPLADVLEQPHEKPDEPTLPIHEATKEIPVCNERRFSSLMTPTPS